jgi:23S rRNA pseudouridine2605 synthase
LHFILLQNSKTHNMKKASGFERFYKGGPKTGGAKKEEFRKEKREARKEREEKFKQLKQTKSRFSVQKPGGEKRAEAPKYNLEAPKSKFKVQKAKPVDEAMPLNKYIAHSGVCSRRDAVDLIKGGKVKVNGELILEPGHKVALTDSVAVAGKKIKPVQDLVYILLNKPKDYLTTTDDPQQRKTVLDLLKGAPDTRLYPVGRLDRNTSGVLLLTNDGDLSQMLTHPSNEIKKVYAVTLDKPLTKAHFDAIIKGVPLEDGMANVDVLAFPDAKDLTQVGVEIHSGRNRIVRRIFEHFGYDVKALDRVVFAGLTKKNVNRGKWRFLTEKELRNLKFFGKGK